MLIRFFLKSESRFIKLIRKKIHHSATIPRNTLTPQGTNEMKLETEKEIEYKCTIMEMRNIIKNQERVIEELMLKVLDIKIENEEVGEVLKSKTY